MNHIKGYLCSQQDMQLCLFNYIHVIYFKTETWNQTMIDLAAVFPCLSSSDSAVLQLYYREQVVR